MRRRRRSRNIPTTPVVLDIEKLSHEGRGIAHHEGKVVFVEGALPGETVTALFTSRRDSFDEAKLSGIEKASSERVEPACKYAGICGGCSLLHFDARSQMAFKQEMLLEKLRHAVPGAAFDVIPPLEGPVLGYRRKARLAVRYVHKKEQVLVGFREKHSTFITHMDSCAVLDARLSNLLPALSALIGNLQSFRHIPQVEVAGGDPDSQGPTCALVFRHLLPLPDTDTEKLLAFGNDHGVAIYLQSGGMDTVHRICPETGEDRLYYRLPEHDLTMAFHPTDFTQVNGDINRRMIMQALSLLDPVADDRVLDLFCGLGNFTLPLARLASHVTGIEGAQEMVERGQENARCNGLDNTAFHCTDLTKSMQGVAWMASGFTKVLLDPPRSGAWEILPDIIALRPSRIVYVSCNPATLARDAEYLAGNGYALAQAGAMDMFPQTAHVEAMALFVDSRQGTGRKS
jgi:23S rRNA (uracil1939-C5)-methyltransferase